jgi:hypothetical protein
MEILTTTVNGIDYSLVYAAGGNTAYIDNLEDFQHMIDTFQIVELQ